MKEITFAEIKSVAARKAKRAIHDDRNMVWIFIDERGRGIKISDDYPYLPASEQLEVLKGFKHWLGVSGDGQYNNQPSTWRK